MSFIHIHILYTKQLLNVFISLSISLTFSHSLSLSLWPGERFVPETFESGYKITMRLTIYDVDISDFGAYRCVAKNSLGDTDGAIKLYRKYEYSQQ